MHLEYTSRAFNRLGPQVFAAILDRAKSWVRSFASTALRWAFQESLQSSQTPKRKIKRKKKKKNKKNKEDEKK